MGSSPYKFINCTDITWAIHVNNNIIENIQSCEEKYISKDLMKKPLYVSSNNIEIDLHKLRHRKYIQNGNYLCWRENYTIYFLCFVATSGSEIESLPIDIATRQDYPSTSIINNSSFTREIILTLSSSRDDIRITLRQGEQTKYKIDNGYKLIQEAGNEFTFWAPDFSTILYDFPYQHVLISNHSTQNIIVSEFDSSTHLTKQSIIIPSTRRDCIMVKSIRTIRDTELPCPHTNIITSYMFDSLFVDIDTINPQTSYIKFYPEQGG